MINLSKVSDASAPVRVMWDRIEQHTKKGGMLEGLNINFRADSKVVGQQDCPVLRFGLPIYTSNNSIAGSSARAGVPMTINGPQGKATTLENNLRQIFQLATFEGDGWFNDIDKRKGHFDWLYAILDAMEINPYTGDVDMYLLNTTTRPFEISQTDPDISQTLITSEITVTSIQSFRARGGRTSTFIDPEPGSK